MFNQISRTGTGVIITLVAYGLDWLGMADNKVMAANFVQALVEVIGFVIIVWGTFKRKDLELAFFRK